jgi:hypothetical protein
MSVDDRIKARHWNVGPMHRLFHGQNAYDHGMHHVRTEIGRSKGVKILTTHYYEVHPHFIELQQKVCCQRGPDLYLIETELPDKGYTLLEYEGDKNSPDVKNLPNIQVWVKHKEKIELSFMNLSEGKFDTETSRPSLPDLIVYEVQHDVKV